MGKQPIIKVRNKRTGEIINLHDGAYEVGDAFIVPLACLYKTEYERVDDEQVKKEAL